MVRSLMLRAPDGPQTPNVPVPPPPELAPPPTLRDDENGYVALVRVLDKWPTEGPYPPDFIHWRSRHKTESAAAERALAPYRPVLDEIERPLAMPNWQVPVDENFSWPEIPILRRLVQALTLRATLDRRLDDQTKAVEIARHVRRSQGPFLHFLVGIGMEKIAAGDFSGLEEDRKAAVRWELARCLIPHVHLNGPWDPPRWELPPDWKDERRATQWLLGGNPNPFDPQATVDLLVAERSGLETATGAELRARAAELAKAWPEEMRSGSTWAPQRVPLPSLRQARPALSARPNALGELQVARALLAAANLADAAAKVTSSD